MKLDSSLNTKTVFMIPESWFNPKHQKTEFMIPESWLAPNTGSIYKSFNDSIYLFNINETKQPYLPITAAGLLGPYLVYNDGHIL